MKFLKNYILALDKNVEIVPNISNTSFYVKFPFGFKIRISNHFTTKMTYDMSIIRSFNSNVYIVLFKDSAMGLTLTTKQVKDLIFSQYWMYKSISMSNQQEIDRLKKVHEKKSAESQVGENGNTPVFLTPTEARMKITKEFPDLFSLNMKDVKFTIGNMCTIWKLFGYDSTKFRAFIYNIPPTYKPSWKQNKAKRVQSYFDILKKNGQLPKEVQDNLNNNMKK